MAVDVARYHRYKYDTCESTNMEHVDVADLWCAICGCGIPVALPGWAEKGSHSFSCAALIEESHSSAFEFSSWDWHSSIAPASSLARSSSCQSWAAEGRESAADGEAAEAETGSETMREQEVLFPWCRVQILFS